MKLLIAVLLAVFSTSVMAEWTMVGFSDSSFHSADLSTIRKSGNKVKMWVLLDFKVVQTQESDGKRYLSTSSQKEYDCKEETGRMLALIRYSKHMGDGEVVYTSGAIHAEFEPTPPGSVDAGLFKVACGK